MSNKENSILFEHRLPTGQILRVVLGDITMESVDAIVNAANEYLMHGSGVAGAIRREGGAVIQQESSAWVQQHGPVATGNAAITSGGNLVAKSVIHAVGPIWGTAHEEGKLASAVQSALALADSQHLVSISIPGISSGIYGGPKEICARVIVQATVNYLKQNNSTLQEIRFCNIDRPTASVFVEEVKNLLD